MPKTPGKIRMYDMVKIDTPPPPPPGSLTI